MNSELTDNFVKCFAKLPEEVKKSARKNYKLWKQNPKHGFPRKAKKFNGKVRRFAPHFTALS